MTNYPLSCNLSIICNKYCGQR